MLLNDALLEDIWLFY